MAREDFLPAAPGKQVYLLKRATYEKLMELAARPEVKMDPTQFDMIERAGAKFYRFKQPLGKPDTTKRGGWDRFGVWVDEARQMLMVDPGSIVYQGAVGGTHYGPVFPRLDGTPINEKDENGWGPGFEIGGKSTGVTYSLVLTYEVIDCDNTHVPDGEIPAEGINELMLVSPGEIDGMDLEDNVAVLIIADVTFTDGDLGLRIDTLKQYLGSDFHPMCSGGSDSGSGSESGSSEASSSDSSSDSSDDESMPSGSSDPDESGSSDQPGCCPNIDITIGGTSVLVSGSEPCFENSETGGPLWATVAFEVSVIQTGPDACGTNCRNWYATVTVPGGQFAIPGGGGWGGASTTYGLGLGGSHTFGLSCRLSPAFPCADRTIRVEVGNAGGANLVPPEMRERCEQTLCTKSASFRLPPWCDDDCVSDSSDSTGPTLVPPDSSSSSSSESDPV